MFHDGGLFLSSNNEQTNSTSYDEWSHKKKENLEDNEKQRNKTKSKK